MATKLNDFPGPFNPKHSMILKSIFMNDGAGQTTRQPSMVFGTLLLLAGSHAGACPGTWLTWLT